MTPKTQGAVRLYLIAITVPRDRGELLELLARTAASFFDIVGGAERQNLGRFARAGRGTAGELLELVRFGVAERAGDEPLTMARRLETVLRAALEATVSDSASARVFLSNPEVAP